MGTKEEVKQRYSNKAGFYAMNVPLPRIEL